MNFTEFRARYERREIIPYPNKVLEKPLLSVLVQAYNHENFIRECLDSILDQKTDFDFEVLLGEDNSSDKTRQICIEYAENYPEKIRLFLHHPENKIKVLNITTGNFNAFYNFYSARGDYVAFCEGDDFWTDPYKLQKQVQYLSKNPECVFSYHKYSVSFTESGNDLEKYIQPSQDISKEELILNIEHPLLLTVCFRNIIRELPEEIFEVINVDLFLLSLLGTYGKGAYQTEIEPAVSRKHSGGIWKSQERYRQLEIKIYTLKKLEEFYSGKNKEAKDFFRAKRKNLAKTLIKKNFRSVHFCALIRSLGYYFH